MEQAEELVDDTRRKLEQHMRLYTVSHLNSVNMDQHASEIKETQQILTNLIHANGKLVKKFFAEVWWIRWDLSLENEVRFQMLL